MNATNQALLKQWNDRDDIVHTLRTRDGACALTGFTYTTPDGEPFVLVAQGESESDDEWYELNEHGVAQVLVHYVNRPGHVVLWTHPKHLGMEWSESAEIVIRSRSLTPDLLRSILEADRDAIVWALHVGCRCRLAVTGPEASEVEIAELGLADTIAELGADHAETGAW